MPTNTTTVRAPDPPKSDAPLRVTSTSFSDGGKIATRYAFQGCGGQNVSPQLSWSDAPEGTKSYAITCFDPDAPTGSGYWHWLAFNIPASVTSLNEGAGSQSPAGGTSATNDYGMVGYGGPCPPKGDIDHHYHFTIYALDVEKLEGPTEKTTGASLVFMMRGHLLATGKIVGTFSH
jgi:Raf kinase inhibitor-like YbhB/YbcL family protein